MRRVRYRLSEPIVIHCCHCLNCQRQTGSAFVINMLIEADRWSARWRPQPVEVPRDDGSAQRIFRCPAARSRSSASTGDPEVRFVRAGTLDRPVRWSRPTFIFSRSRR